MRQTPKKQEKEKHESALPSLTELELFFWGVCKK
jgi:hypothetical protein